MKVSEATLKGVLVFEPVRYQDSRGTFVETFKDESYRRAGIGGLFVQDNLSRSKQNVLRGLHYQRRQGKLVTVVRGEIFDVALDIRPESPTFGQWLGTALSEADCRQIYIPPGFAHGFQVLSAEADVWYKATDVYRPDEEGGIRWDDPDLGIEWPLADPIVSDRDRLHPALKDVDRKLLVSD